MVCCNKSKIGREVDGFRNTYMIIISEIVNNMCFTKRNDIYSHGTRLDSKGLSLMCAFAGTERHECKQEEPWRRNFT